jgi:predicted  nucleic acid-binding Zn-ribbon protein
VDGAGGGMDAKEIAALQSVISDLTKERMAFQRGLERSQELMQTLADENEAMTSHFNAQAHQLAGGGHKVQGLGLRFQVLGCRAQGCALWV